MNGRPARKGRLIALTRGGKGVPPARNRRRVAQEARAGRAVPRLPLPSLRAAFSLLAFCALPLLLLAGVCLALVYGYRSATLGEYFAVKTVEIHGNSRLHSREILKIVDLEEGANTLALSIDAVENALSGHPWVEEASVKRVLPDRIIISVKEKVPVFLIRHEGGRYYADRRGNGIAPVSSADDPSLPVLEVEPAAGWMRGLLPDLIKSLHDTKVLQGMGGISRIRLSAARTLELVAEGTGPVFSIDIDDWLSNLRRLGRVLADLSRRGELAGTGAVRVQGANVWVERRAEGRTAAG
jgi:cell division protein FtsQ